MKTNVIVPMRRDDVQFNFRMPADFKARISEIAKKNSRSLTAEMLLRLEGSIACEESVNSATRLDMKKSEIIPFGLRIPPEMRDQLEAEAEKSQRTMTAEILRRLESTLALGADMAGTDPQMNKQVSTYPLRFPPDLRRKLEAKAEESGRTLRAEILFCIEGGLAREEPGNGSAALSVTMDEDMIRLASESLTQAIHCIADKLIEEQRESQS